MSKVREAIKLLELALPATPTGSDAHKAVIDSLSKLSKTFPASEAVPGVQQTQLRALQADAQKSAMMQALLRQQASQGGAPGGAQPEGGEPPPLMAQQ